MACLCRDRSSSTSTHVTSATIDSRTRHSLHSSSTTYSPYASILFSIEVSPWKPRDNHGAGCSTRNRCPLTSQLWVCLERCLFWSGSAVKVTVMRYRKALQDFALVHKVAVPPICFFSPKMKRLKATAVQDAFLVLVLEWITNLDLLLRSLLIFSGNSTTTTPKLEAESLTTSHTIFRQLLNWCQRYKRFPRTEALKCKHPFLKVRSFQCNT